MKIERWFLAACLSLISCCVTAADEPLLDAEAALRQSFKTREKLVSGSCTITGVNHTRDPIHRGPGPDTKLELVFDFSVPVFRIQEHGTGIYMSTPEYQYQTNGSRQFIDRFPLDQKPIRDPRPFHLHTLGFVSRPNAHVWDIAHLNYGQVRDRLLASEILEAEMEDNLLRIRLERPRVDGDHFAVQYELWLDPQKGYAPRRIELFAADTKRLLLRSDLDWKSINETWVITSFKQTLRKDMPDQLRWKFDWHSVNEPIPESRFDLSTFPLSGEMVDLRDRLTNGIHQKVGTVEGISRSD